MKRRSLLAAAAAFAVIAPGAAGAAAIGAGKAPVARSAAAPRPLYGLIGKIRAVPGQRAALARILIEAVPGLPGCRSYVVAEDPQDGDLLWITEIWESRDAHAASLKLPAVGEAIRRGRPLIAGMERVAETAPLTGPAGR